MSRQDVCDSYKEIKALQIRASKTIAFTNPFLEGDVHDEKKNSHGSSAPDRQEVTTRTFPLRSSDKESIPLVNNNSRRLQTLRTVAYRQSTARAVGSHVNAAILERSRPAVSNTGPGRWNLASPIWRRRRRIAALRRGDNAPSIPMSLFLCPHSYVPDPVSLFLHT